MPHPPRSRPARSSGLDTLRALAIVLVFAFHEAIFFSHRPTFGVVSRIGWVGVDLFFVLSGFLIGDQLIAERRARGTVDLPRFYARRLLRTLPAYWVVLALYVALPDVMGGRTPPPLWRFLTFTQNLGLTGGTAFSHAWSLCVEEQFYLVLPLVLLLVASLGSRRATAWAMGIALGIAITARALIWRAHGQDANGYQTWIYYASICRFDEFLPGIAVAVVKNLHPRAWKAARARPHLTLGAGLVATAVMFALFLTAHEQDDGGHTFWMTVLGYPLLASAFALLVLSALSPGSLLARVQLPGARQLALWSYAIYLSHKALMHIAGESMPALGLQPGTLSAVAVLAPICVAVGWVLHLLVEQPCMRLRPTAAAHRFPGRASRRA